MSVSRRGFLQGLGSGRTAKAAAFMAGRGHEEYVAELMQQGGRPERRAQAIPTFENCGGVARQLGYPVKSAPVDARMKTDLAAILPLVKGAGLVYICNPNNPTSTIVGSKELTDFVNEVRKASPTTAILIDEAYYDYITDSSYTTLIPLALQTPQVVVARTFSKAYGMAGVRIGYGIGVAATIKKMAAYRMPYNVNTFGVAAAVASLKDPKHIEEERARNTSVRDFTVKALADMGCTSAESQGNFIFADIGKTMTAAAFRDACAKQGVMVGRDFPPVEKQWARISLGTMDEMQRATAVFRNVLRPTTTTAGKQQ